LKLKLDENVGSRGVTLLKDAGHDVSTVVEQGLCSAQDPALLDACRSEQRCLVTLDVDFANPLRFKPVEHPGIAVLRLPPKPTHDDLLNQVRTLVGALSQASPPGPGVFSTKRSASCVVSG